MTAALLLAVDVGNTNTVFAVYQDQKALGQWRISTIRDRTGDEYSAALTQLMALDGIDYRGGPGRRHLVGRAPGSALRLKACARHVFGCTPKIIRENLDVTVEIAMDNPKEVGADRLVNAVAAHGRYQGAADHDRFRHGDHF